METLNYLYSVLLSFLLLGCCAVSTQPCETCSKKEVFKKLLAREPFSRENVFQYDSDLNKTRALYDKYIVPTLNDKSEAEKYRQLLYQNKAWVYWTDSLPDHRHYVFQQTFPEEFLSGYAFRQIWSGVYPNGTYEWNEQNNGFLELSSLDGSFTIPYSSHPYCKDYDSVGMPILIDDGLINHVKDENLTIPDDMGKNKIVCVVDVVDVCCAGITKLDYMRRYSESCACELPLIEYNAKMDVRKVEQGKMTADALSAKVIMYPLSLLYPSWHFYRGMTLRLEMVSTQTGYVVSHYAVVNPFPPYDEEGVEVKGGTLKAMRESEDLKKGIEGGLNPLRVKYRDGTCVEYCAGMVNPISQYGSRVDFGIHSTCRIVEKGDDSQREFWQYTWQNFLK